jgi:hypothetical protein
MVHWDKVEEQLERIGCNYKFWGRAEVRELCHVLFDDENIRHCVNGQYPNGFAMLCATDHRLLLIDKKPMNYVNIVDIRFEMISEFDYSRRMMNSRVHICTPTKSLIFSSWKAPQLRALLTYVQQRVIEIRQYQYLGQQFQQQAMEMFQRVPVPRQQQQPQQPPTYVPNTAPQSYYSAATSSSEQNSGLSSAARNLGAHTYSKLPHFRIRGTRHLGEYAMPDDIYPMGRYGDAV